MKPIRMKKGRALKDDRKFFSFTLPDGKIAETKATTREEARAMIEDALGIQLQEAA